MIGKLKKGSSFGGCIRYVTGKDEAKIIASDGVLLGTNAEMAQCFELQRQLNPRIKKPVGHIALSFKPEDKPRLTDEFMAKIAIEYMQMMGITDTQFIIVRHHNTDNPHCHIVYNRINNEGKLISDRNDYRRNEQVTKALKSKYGLTYGTDKSNTNTRKLRNAERRSSAQKISRSRGRVLLPDAGKPRAGCDNSDPRDAPGAVGNFGGGAGCPCLGEHQIGRAHV